MIRHFLTALVAVIALAAAPINTMAAGIQVVSTAISTATAQAAPERPDSLPTGHRAAFLNGIYELAPSVNIIVTDEGKIVGSVPSVDGQLFIMTVISHASGVTDAVLTSLNVRLSDGTTTTFDLPSQATILMTGIGDCANRTSERYDYPNGSGGADLIVLSYCPK